MKMRRNVNIYLKGILIFCEENQKSMCESSFLYIGQKFSLSENESFLPEIDLTKKISEKIEENILIQYAQFKDVLSKGKFSCKKVVKNYPNIILKLST